MNIVSVTVSAALMGLIAPGIAQMSIAPMVAQKQQANFSIAESAAVTYAANAEQTSSLPPVPDKCTRTNPSDDAYLITCTEGEGQFQMTAARAFRTNVVSSGPARKSGPYTPGIFCPPWDPDGTDSFDNDHNVNCNPNYPS